MNLTSAQNGQILFGTTSYEVLSEFLKNEKYSQIFILTDSNTMEYCIPVLLPNLDIDIPFEIIEIEAGEEYKTIETCFGVWQTLAELGADRKSLLLTLGGGVVTDLGGFVASTFKRGIDCINVPTTLLSMVDASVGGKTGVDLGILKNEVGTFAVPKIVLIDRRYLETLPNDEMLSGLAEMLKHGLIADDHYWRRLSDLRQLTTDDLQDLIFKSVQIKNTIILQDPKEQNERKKLNFGHTLGHAIESLFLQMEDKTTLKHGYAVAAGMVLEAYISYKKQLISKEYYQEIQSVINGLYEKVDFTQDDILDIIKLLKHDKKNRDGKVMFTLLKSRGDSVYDQEVPTNFVFEAFEDYLN